MKRATRMLLIVLFLLASLCLFTCDKYEPAIEDEPAIEIELDVVKSDLLRIMNLDVEQANLKELVAGNSTFAFSLYQLLKEEKYGNFFYSPYSISLALAMAYAGAENNTEQQMKDVLHFTLPEEDFHPAFNYLDLDLMSRGENAQGMDGEPFRLNIVNDIWGQVDYNFLSFFLDVLAENYGAGLNLVDFINETENARQTINDWISQQTEERIKDLLPEGSITQLTRLVLTNAIYFNAAWLFQFEEQSTSNGTFTLLNSSSVTTSMMNQTECFNYMEGESYKAIELPYDGDEIAMVILVPDAGTFETFEGNLDLTLVSSIIENLSSTNINLKMPKWEFDSDLSLSSALGGMGMTDALIDGIADFSGIDGTQFLLISDVVHKAFVLVNESGTEAAAATGVIFEFISVPPPPIDFTINRPFIFFIRDMETDTILFIGRVLNPEE